MKKDNKLFRAGSLYFIGNVFDKAVAFFTVPIFTRMLSTSDYGIVTSYLSWENVLSVVLTLSLGNSLRTALIDFSQDEDGYMSAILTLAAISSTVLSGVILAVCTITKNSLLIALMPICCVHAFSTGVIQAVQLRYTLNVQYVRRTLLQCVPNILVVILSIVIINRLESERYYGRIYAYAIVMSGTAVGYVLYYFIKGKRFIILSYWRYALSFSLPVIFHGLSLVILSQADRSMLLWLKDASEAGIYGLAYQFGQVPLAVTMTLENVWMPWFISKMQVGERTEINRKIKLYLYFAALLCIGIMLSAPVALKIMTTKDYYGAIHMITPVVAATFFQFLSGFSIQLEYYKKSTRIIAVNTIVAAVLNIVLNYIFIPMYGGVAAAFTTTVSYAVTFAMHYIFARRLDRELFPIRVYLMPIGLISVTSIIIQLFILK